MMFLISVEIMLNGAPDDSLCWIAYWYQGNPRFICLPLHALSSSSSSFFSGLKEPFCLFLLAWVLIKRFWHRPKSSQKATFELASSWNALSCSPQKSKKWSLFFNSGLKKAILAWKKMDVDWWNQWRQTGRKERQKSLRTRRKRIINQVTKRPHR